MKNHIRENFILTLIIFNVVVTFFVTFKIFMSFLLLSLIFYYIYILFESEYLIKNNQAVVSLKPFDTHKKLVEQTNYFFDIYATIIFAFIFLLIINYDFFYY